MGTAVSDLEFCDKQCMCALGGYQEHGKCHILTLPAVSGPPRSRSRALLMGCPGWGSDCSWQHHRQMVVTEEGMGPSTEGNTCAGSFFEQLSLGEGPIPRQL
jgi:hypothetical protein